MLIITEYVLIASLLSSPGAADLLINYYSSYFGFFTSYSISNSDIWIRFLIIILNDIFIL